VPAGIGVLVGSGCVCDGLAADGLDGDALVGFDGLAVDDGLAEGAIAPGVCDAAALAGAFTPPAACSNSFRCVRKS